VALFVASKVIVKTGAALPSEVPASEFMVVREMKTRMRKAAALKSMDSNVRAAREFRARASGYMQASSSFHA
jgi:hypothetical protein